MNYYNDIAFKHLTPIQIRFDDIDGMEHVNNTVILSYFDFAKLKYLTLLNKELPENEKQGLVIARYETDFFKPVFLHEDVFVETAIVSFGNKSLVFVQRLRTQEEIKSVCKTIMSGFDKATYASTIVNESFKNAVEKFEERKILSKTV